jgi:hypothetical protein
LPDFGARHIAALAMSNSTKSHVFALSEETGKVREFAKGKIKQQFPKEKYDIEPEKIQEQLIKEGIKKRTISTTRFKNFIVHKILRFAKK